MVDEPQANLTREEALAEAWASIDGKLGRFRANKADRSLDRTDGAYPGYLEEAREMIRRLENRGYTIVSARVNPHPGNPDPVPDDLAAEIKDLERMADESIDTSDMPEVGDWSGAYRGRFYRPKTASTEATNPRRPTTLVEAEVLNDTKLALQCMETGDWCRAKLLLRLAIGSLSDAGVGNDG